MKKMLLKSLYNTRYCKFFIQKKLLLLHYDTTRNVKNLIVDDVVSQLPDLSFKTDEILKACVYHL